MLGGTALCSLTQPPVRRCGSPQRTVGIAICIHFSDSDIKPAQSGGGHARTACPLPLCLFYPSSDILIGDSRAISRREFLRRGSLLTGAVLTHQRHKLRIDKVRPALDGRSLPPFVDPLPILTVAKSAAMRASPTSPSVKIPYYRVNAGEFFGKAGSRDLKPTRMWGSGRGRFPGRPSISPAARSILVEWGQTRCRTKTFPANRPQFARCRSGTAGIANGRSLTWG